MELKFFASVCLEICSTGNTKFVKSDEDIGLRVRVRVQKSKVNKNYISEFEDIGSCNTLDSTRQT